MVATKENSLGKDTLSSSLSGTLRMWSSKNCQVTPRLAASLCVSELVKAVPLSETIRDGVPQRLKNIRKLFTHESADRLCMDSV